MKTYKQWLLGENVSDMHLTAAEVEAIREILDDHPDFWSQTSGSELAKMHNLGQDFANKLFALGIGRESYKPNY